MSYYTILEMRNSNTYYVPDNVRISYVFKSLQQPKNYITNLI
jgi:hypothetical protein